MRTSSTVIRMLWPVSGGKETGTSTTEPATGLSATVGRVTLTLSLFAETVSAVGTECWPSAAIWRSRWSKVIGLGRTYWSH